MSFVPAKTVTAALNWRYATKKFDPAQKIHADTWFALEESLVLTPSSAGLQPWKFIIVTDKEVAAKLSAASHGQPQAVDCSHFVVFASRKDLGLHDLDRHVKRTAAVRSVTTESLQKYRDSIGGSIERAAKSGFLGTWVDRQPYIALGQFMASAALMGVDTCPMEGIDHAKFDEILGLHAMGYHALCACAAGYRSADDKYATTPKVRFEMDEVIVRV
ncbi:MAG TPA: NAD(P)H-dependent oxidoreductase [Opitutaceae bacterium]|jgi:nitroreductase|nr:NAD(P)H-dependent oxidoreductase [Opitutaceae bacterium]